MKRLAHAVAALAVVLIAGCTERPTTVSQNDIDALAAELKALGPGVDPREAERAAYVAFTYTQQLAKDYEITDPPLVHNAKVNTGLRPRGLCFHWAEDIEARLKQENFRTLKLHRAIADPENSWRIDHSTAIISRRGDDMYKGIVLDGWRYGGVLFHAPVSEDTRYNWRPRLEVLHNKYLERESQKQSLVGG